MVKRLKPKKSVMENLETQRKVWEVYLDFVKKGELIRINGNKPVKDVANDILKVAQEILRKRQG